MPDDYRVNDQIIDSVVETSASVLGSAPAQTTGMLDALMTETLGMAMHNAVTTQHNSQMVTTAAITAACGRMLKISSATMLPAKPVKPIIVGISPNPVPPSPDIQMVEVAGVGFQTGVTVEVSDSGGKSIGKLMGSRQIREVTPTSFLMATNLFASEADYVIQATNPDGSMTSPYAVSVVAPPPRITAVTPLPSGSPNTDASSDPPNTNSYTVAGTGFQANLAVAVTDHNFNSLPVLEVTFITSRSFTMTLAPSSSAVFSIEVTNPDGRKSNQLMFAAAPA